MHSVSHKFGFWSKCEVVYSTSVFPHSRVGHTAHHLPVNERNGWVLLVGGANHSSCCSNYLLYNLRKGQLESCRIPKNDSEVGAPRYEQASVVLDNELVQFGGANSESPLNDVFHFPMSRDVLPSYGNPTGDLFTSSVITTGPPTIEKRTQHSSGCMTDCGELIVFAGGGMGSCPVEDTQVHLYNIKKKKWIVIKTDSEGPCPRMGHLMLYQSSSQSNILNSGAGEESFGGTKKSFLYTSGGMSGSDFFDDFWRLDIERTLNAEEQENITGIWQQIQPAEKGSGSSVGSVIDGEANKTFWPVARAAHGGAILISPLSDSLHPLSRIFIFAGVNSEGPLNDLAYYDEVSSQWTQVLIPDSNPPSPRMDFAFTTLRIKVRDPNYIKEEDSITCGLPTLPISSVIQVDEKAYMWRTYLFVHGGMNTERMIFADVYVCCLDGEK